MGTPFTVTAVMRSPVVMTPYTTLDAILAAAVVKERGGDWTPPIPLPLDADDTGILFRASSWTGGGIVGSQNSFFHRRLEADIFVQATDAKKFVFDTIEGTGPFRSYRVSYAALMMRDITFHCVGNIEEVKRLLLRNIGSLGAMRGKGFGSIEKWKFAPDTKDLSLVNKNGLPARPLPMTVAKRLGVTGPTIQFQTRAPYWNRGGILCVAPPWPWPEPDYSVKMPDKTFSPSSIKEQPVIETDEPAHE